MEKAQISPHKNFYLDSNMQDSSPNQHTELSNKKNTKFKYLTTNMQNLVKSFNENLISPRKDMSNPKITMDQSQLRKSLQNPSSSEKKIDLDYLTKKLRQIQNSQQQQSINNPTPSSAQPVQHKPMNNHRHNEMQRSVSNMDHNRTQIDHGDYIKNLPRDLHKDSKDKFNRSQSQLNYTTIKPRSSATFDKRNENYSILSCKLKSPRMKKSKSTNIIKISSSSKSSFNSDSFDSDRTTASSSTTQTPSRSRSSSPSIELNPARYLTKNTNQYPQSLNRKQNYAKNDLTYSEQFSSERSKNSTLHRRSSTTHLDTPKSIVIRREKSINLNTTSRNLDLPTMKQALLASIANSSKEGSSTTSGIETASKTSGFNTTTNNLDGSKRANLKNTDASSCANNAANNYVTKINELKNRLFVLEIELNSEKKKLSQEKEHKQKLVNELKSRHETEKLAALKALEAKLNAEKVYELNKLKETVDSEKREEIDSTHKTFDSEILNLKLKLRDKAEKYAFLFV